MPLISHKSKKCLWSFLQKTKLNRQGGAELSCHSQSGANNAVQGDPLNPDKYFVKSLTGYIRQQIICASDIVPTRQSSKYTVWTIKILRFFTRNHLVMNPAIPKKSPKPGKFASGSTGHAHAKNKNIILRSVIGLLCTKRSVLNEHLVLELSI